jgi:hypothetical protein
MLRVVALRALPIAHQLGLCLLPGLGIDERGHPDRDPFSLRASRATLAIAGVAIFEPPRVIRTAYLSRLCAIVIGFPFINGIAEDLNHTTLRPPTVLGFPGWNPLQGEAPMNGIGALLLFDTPAIDLPDDLCFSLVDDQMLRRGRRLADVRIVIRRIAPVDKPLSCGKELSAPRAVLDQGTLILGKDTLHLLFRCCAQALMDKHHLTATAEAFLDQDHLIGRAARQTIRRCDQHDLESAFGHQIA